MKIMKKNLPVMPKKKKKKKKTPLITLAMILVEMFLVKDL
jgi:hypothetical protein